MGKLEQRHRNWQTEQSFYEQRSENWRNKVENWKETDRRNNPNALAQLETILPSIAQSAFQADKIRKQEKLTAIHFDKIRTAGLDDYKLLDPTKLGLKDELLKKATAGFELHKTLTTNNVPESVANSLVHSNPVVQWDANREYVLTAQKGAAGFVTKLLSSGAYVEVNGKILHLDGNTQDWDTDTYNIVAGNAIREYYESKGIFGEGGEETLTTKFLEESGFYKEVKQQIINLNSEHEKLFNSARAVEREEGLKKHLNVEAQSDESAIDFNYVLGTAMTFHDAQGKPFTDWGQAHKWLETTIKEIADTHPTRAKIIIDQMKENGYIKNGKKAKFGDQLIEGLYTHQAKALQTWLDNQKERQNVAENTAVKWLIDGKDNEGNPFSLPQLIEHAEENGYNWREAQLTADNKKKGGTVKGQLALLEKDAVNGVYPKLSDVNTYLPEVQERARELAKLGDGFATRLTTNKGTWNANLGDIRAKIKVGVAYLQDSGWAQGEAFQVENLAIIDLERKTKMYLALEYPPQKAIQEAGKEVLKKLEKIVDFETLKQTDYYQDYKRGFSLEQADILSDFGDLLKDNNHLITSSTTIAELPSLDRLNSLPENTKRDIANWASKQQGRAPEALDQLWRKYYYSSRANPNKIENKQEFAKWLTKQGFGMDTKGTQVSPKKNKETNSRVDNAQAKYDAFPTQGSLYALMVEESGNIVTAPWFTGVST